MSLHIGLTEPVVFLRRSSDTSASGRRRQVTTDASPRILRGVLTLKVSKATKIRSVELFLDGTVTTEWPEGIGPLHTDLTEEHVVISARAILFRAGDRSPDAFHRRAQSLGPGVLAGYGSDGDSDGEDERGRRLPQDPVYHDASRSRSPDRNMIGNRGVSMDQSARYGYPMTELPPYPVPSPIYTPEPLLRDLPEEEGPSRTLEELRQVLRSTTDHFVQQPGLAGRSSSALRSAASSRPTTSASRSRPPSFRGSSLYLEPVDLSPTPSRLLDTRHSDDHSPSRAEDSLGLAPLSPVVSTQRRASFSRNTAGPSTSSPRRTSAAPGGHSTPTKPGTSVLEGPNRSQQKRFSFGIAWQEMKELVRPSSRRPSMATTERPLSPRPAPAASSSRPTSAIGISQGGSASRKRDVSRGRDRTVVGKLSGALGLEDDKKDLDWKEFRKGTYNWPISFIIPMECPPTIRCDYGSVAYRVRAQVNRVGTFAPNLFASADVTIIACPGEDDTEESESIVVEREWDNKLQYLIALSGKSFPIGGTIPLHITLMPLSKIGIYRISVLLEEKVDYFAHGNKIARHEPVRRYQLLGIKRHDMNTALLPTFSESPDAATHHPLLPFVDEEDPSEAAGQLLTPTGPWTLRFLLKVPDCTTKIHFTNKYGKAKIVVSHAIKIVMRVDKGDDSELDAKGKRKQFDIIVESPIQLLSCRCNPEWMSLPTYSLFPVEASSNAYGCICHSRRGTRAAPTADDSSHLIDMDYPHPVMGLLAAGRQRSPHVHGSRIGGDHSVQTRGVDMLDDRNRQYALLVSGSEREDGERPPTYEAATVPP